jgi:hypothetical protein
MFATPVTVVDELKTAAFDNLDEPSTISARPFAFVMVRISFRVVAPDTLRDDFRCTASNT